MLNNHLQVNKQNKGFKISL